MKLAIMQPYFFPYIGYFQLINAVDKFVFYDDVNYIKSGWINRNRLFLADSIRYITVPLAGASSFEKINKIDVKAGDDWVKAMLSSVAQYYGKAPFYKPVRELLKMVLDNKNDNLADLARHSITATAEYLGLSTEFVKSSVIYDNQGKRGVERVLDICRIERADEYWNLPGGRNLYSAEIFLKNGIDLKFVDVSIKPYEQNSTEFLPGLSIIDVLMYNDSSSILAMLNPAESPAK